MMNRFMLTALLLLPALIPNTAMAADGQALFKRCAACHAADSDQNKVGPSLKTVFGRTAGTHEGYKYSAAMAGAGFAWDEAALDAFLENPKAKVPGTKMAFPGLKKEEERQAMIEFLKATKQQ